MNSIKAKKLGLLVNPVAGMGGRVGLKGSDGAGTIDRARSLGASPESPRRAVDALRVVAKSSRDVEVVCYPFDMGDFEAKECGFSPTVIGEINPGRTTAEDTFRAAREMKDLDVDLLMFAGGDGTARDIHRAVGGSLTVLGIPTGVKMQSAVFALNPRDAGEVAVSFLSGSNPATEEKEVMDIDEACFRRGLVVGKLHGFLRVPMARSHIQSAKSGGFRPEEQEIAGIAAELATSLEKDCLAIYGPGTTTRDILARFGLDKTLLGVDAVLGGRIVARDASEESLLRLLDDHAKCKIVVTVIGQQGYIFGRGNQQLSPRLIRGIGKENIVVVASKEKLASLQGRPLLVDTGDEEVDERLRGYVRVVVGYNEYAVCRVS
jgi:predicted polyphosphate/ATP-dependent NAD kinase